MSEKPGRDTTTTPDPDCGFCHGGPVGNAARWTDPAASEFARCPRCMDAPRLALSPGAKSLERGSTFQGRGGGLKRGRRHRPSPNPKQWARWASQAADRCAVCGSTDQLSLHHVVYAQHVALRHGDVCEPANSLTTCWTCHEAHHNASRRIPVSCLRDENLEFARELLGLAAYDYFDRRYFDDGDPRLDGLLEEVAP